MRAAGTVMSAELPKQEKASPLPVPSSSSPMINTKQEKKIWINAAALLTAAGLLTGGLTEEFVGDIFAPVREAGGYGNMLNISPPGADEAKRLKQIQRESKPFFLQSARSSEGPTSPQQLA